MGSLGLRRSVIKNINRYGKTVDVRRLVGGSYSNVYTGVKILIGRMRHNTSQDKQMGDRGFRGEDQLYIGCYETKLGIEDGDLIIHGTVSYRVLEDIDIDIIGAISTARLQKENSSSA